MTLVLVDQPAYVEGENVLWQQLGGHEWVKHWRDLSHWYGGVGHAQDPIEPCHCKCDARLLHGFAKLLASNRQTGDLQAEEQEERKTSIRIEKHKAFNELIGMAWPPNLRNAVKQTGSVIERVSDSLWRCPRWWSQTSCLCRTGWRTGCRF